MTLAAVIPASEAVRYRLKVKEANRVWEFIVNQSNFTLGRTEKSTCALPIPILSGVHLEFHHVNGNSWSVMDKNSTNGSFLGDLKMDNEKSFQLSSPFHIRVGQKTLLEITIEDLNLSVSKPVPSNTEKTQTAEKTQGSFRVVTDIAVMGTRLEALERVVAEQKQLIVMLKNEIAELIKISKENKGE